MILNDNSTQQINTLVIQLRNKITNLTNEFRKLNNNISDLDSEISDLERRVSSNENDADNNIGDLDSKISDLERRVSSNENNAAAMNDEILANTEAISGKADKNHTHTKSDITDFPTSLKNPNALTINGKTYDGSSAVNAGVQTVANGGTGVTTQADINKAFIGNLEVGASDVTDGTEFVSSWASDNGFAETAEGAVNKPYKRQFIKVWNYIKYKISSVLGLTADNYGGTAAAILDYAKGTPIKVRWGGPGIDSAEWYPAFNADGSAIEPINRSNIHAGTADSARNMYYQNLDLSALDKTMFYPLVCISNTDFAEVAICSESRMGHMEYNQNRIHFDISTDGWNDLPYTLNIREYACFDNNEITIGCIGRGVHNGAWAIWLRGGIHYTCFSRNADLSLKTSDYTYGDETYTVGTNYYGGSNSNVGVAFTPQYTITEGAYSSRPITSPIIKGYYRMVIPIGAPASLEDGCIWIER